MVLEFYFKYQRSHNILIHVFVAEIPTLNSTIHCTNQIVSCKMKSIALVHIHLCSLFQLVENSECIRLKMYTKLLNFYSVQ